MARVYATVADYTAYTRQGAPPGIDRLLAQASAFVESQVLRLAVYDVDPTTSLPTHPAVQAAIRDAVCAQAEWWGETGDPLGVAGQWQTLRIGSVHLQGPANSGAQSTARQLAPAVQDALGSMDLVGHFRSGPLWQGGPW
ncbi:hypothetical protein [Kitasatospora sp. McL0602]|uniref:hypothetical protein n=1 Tax=Kitasatospora sp. McL0602 TaxID=3439530 RepID=UPI003F88FC7C